MLGGATMRLCVFLFGREVIDVTLDREAADEPETLAVAGTFHDAGYADDDAADPRYRWPEDGAGFRA